MATKKKTTMPVSRARTAYGLLAEIRKLILEEPKRYDQGNWLLRRAYAAPTRRDGFPACGTIGCVAGWVTTLRSDDPDHAAVDSFASRTLGLSPSQSFTLFDGGAVRGRPQSTFHAENGAKHIASFMKEHAEQLKATPLQPVSR